MNSNYKSDKSRSSRVSRRAILAAVGTPAFTLMGSVVHASEGTAEIPYVKYRNEVVQWKTVPQQWWEGERRAVAAMNDLAEQYENHPAVAGVGITRSPRQISGKQASKVELEIGHRHDASSFSTPQTDHTVTIGVRQREELELHLPSSSCNDLWCDTSSYNVPRGGVRLDGSHSAACRVDYNGIHHLMCSAHALNICNQVAPSNEIYHEGSYIGRIVDHDSGEDWAVIENDPNGEFRSFSDRIAGHNIRISGHNSQESLHDMQTSNETVYHRGAKTCTTEGTVQRYGIDMPYDSPCVRV